MTAYSFHPEAEAELADAAVFYEARLGGLGKSFIAEVERTVSLIREHPDAGAPAGLPRRWMRLYSVVYQREPGSVLTSRLPINAGGLDTGDGE